MPDSCHYLRNVDGAGFSLIERSRVPSWCWFSARSIRLGVEPQGMPAIQISLRKPKGDVNPSMSADCLPRSALGDR